MSQQQFYQTCLPTPQWTQHSQTCQRTRVLINFETEKYLFSWNTNWRTSLINSLKWQSSEPEKHLEQFSRNFKTWINKIKKKFKRPKQFFFKLNDYFLLIDFFIIIVSNVHYFFIILSTESIKYAIFTSIFFSYESKMLQESKQIFHIFFSSFFSIAK